MHKIVPILAMATVWSPLVQAQEVGTDVKAAQQEPAPAPLSPPASGPPAPAPAPPVSPAYPAALLAQPAAVAPPPPPPSKIPYVAGMPIPQGYRLEQTRRPGVYVTGIALLGSTWLVSTLAATIELEYGNEGIWPLYIPVIGPFVAIATTDTRSPTGAYMLALDGWHRVRVSRC